MKVVFLAAHAPVAKGGGLERLMKKMCPPLGFLYLESFTKKYFSEHVEFIISDNLDLLLLQDENIPHIIGISSVTENFNFAIDSARKIRNSIDNKIPIIIGGPHISALPHTLPKEFDIGVIGEGEITFTEILKVYQKNGSFPEKDLHDIAGICFHTEKGYVKINPLRIPVTNLDIIPSHIDLVGAEIEMLNMENRERVMERLLNPLRTVYDYILIDCSPSLGLITVNSLTASNSVIIPVQCEYFALEGISKLLNTIKIIKSKLNMGLEIEGFLLTMYDNRLRLANQVLAEVKKHFEGMVFETVISRNVRLSEAPSHGMPVLLYDAESKGSTNYMDLAKELIQKNI